jgi:hypothetical protein
LKQSMVKWESNLKKVFNQENLEKGKGIPWLW